MDFIYSLTGSNAVRVVRDAFSQRLWPGPEQDTVETQHVQAGTTHDSNTDFKRDTGQKKTPEKKDGRRMSFQRPKGTIEYSVESRDTLNSIALKFDTTPNELVQLNKLFSRAVVPGQV